MEHLYSKRRRAETECWKQRNDLMIFTALLTNWMAWVAHDNKTKSASDVCKNKLAFIASCCRFSIMYLPPKRLIANKSWSFIIQLNSQTTCLKLAQINPERALSAFSFIFTTVLIPEHFQWNKSGTQLKGWISALCTHNRQMEQ